VSTTAEITTDQPIDLDAPGAPAHGSVRGGYAYGIAGYLWWGLFPIYFKAVASANSVEVLAHRIIWAVPALALVLAWRRRWREVAAVFRVRRQMRLILISTALIGVNWFVYIYAVLTNRVSEASLGFFINPLVSVALGAIFLAERPSRLQWMAIALAAVGVGVRIVALGELPWIALALPIAFGFYGLVRKTATVKPIPGLFCECTLLLPLALAYLGYLLVAGDASFVYAGPRLSLLLMLAGPVTIIPLLAFTTAAHRLPLATMGLLQYLAPTGQLLLAVLVYKEAFGTPQIASFALIWVAIGLYMADTLAQARRKRARSEEELLHDL
jgi:chloramphenicol-sensitive protein RarD